MPWFRQEDGGVSSARNLPLREVSHTPSIGIDLAAATVVLDQRAAASFSSIESKTSEPGRKAS